MENNIGKLNAIFTQNIANLFAKKDGGKIIREYSLLIMNNKHLLKEYKIFNFIESQQDCENLKDIIIESVNMLNDIDKKELSKAHLKLEAFMSENNIKQIEDIKNEKLFEEIHSLAFMKKNIKTINERVDKINNIVSLIKSNVVPITEEIEINEHNQGFYKFVIDKFNKKYLTELSENEQTMFKIITSAKDSEERKSLFEKEKDECLRLADEYLNEDIDDVTKEKIEMVKAKLSEQKYIPESYLDDIVSLIDLKQILSE